MRLLLLIDKRLTSTRYIFYDKNRSTFLVLFNNIAMQLFPDMQFRYKLQINLLIQILCL